MFSFKNLALSSVAALALAISTQTLAQLSEAQARAIVNDPNRTPDAELDMRRHPVDLLIFTGIEPGMRVADLDAGRGWTTELIARAVGPEGVVYSRTNLDRLGGLRERLDMPGLDHVVPIGRPLTSPLPPEATKLDLVIGQFSWHHLIMAEDAERSAAYARIYHALKPGGVLIASDTEAKAGSPASVGGTIHRLAPNLLRRELEGAGFEFVEASDLLDNPNDPLDVPFNQVDGVSSGFLHKYRKPM